MDITRKDLDDHKVQLTIKAAQSQLEDLKKHTLEKLQPEIEAPGFRKGKAPLNVVEKQVKDEYLQTQFLDEALGHLYNDAVVDQKIRVLDRPEINVVKFVPFTELEFTATVTIVPPVKLGDYKKIKAKAEEVKVTAKDIDEVIENLRTRVAEKVEVERAAKLEDEAVIDFSGVDKDGKEVAGAKGNDYPLALGSNTFIPGFEDEVIGMKPGEEKTFDITFPKDYGHKPLANAKVTFTITVKSVKEVQLPKVDDALAKKVGPFGELKALKDDIKAQLEQQKRQEATDKLKDEVVGKLVEKSEITVPEILLQDQINILKDDFTRNLTYRGITLPEYLEQSNTTEEDFVKNEITPKAERRVKAGLVLAEVADQEKLSVEPDELEIRLQLLKGQNQTQAAEFDKPEVQRDVASRMLTEKTVDKLVEYASK